VQEAAPPERDVTPEYSDCGHERRWRRACRSLLRDSGERLL